VSPAAGRGIVIADLYHANHGRLDSFKVEPGSSIAGIERSLDGYILSHYLHRIPLDGLCGLEVDFLIEIDSAAFKADVYPNRFQPELLFGDAGDNMLGGMPACNTQSMLPVHTGNVPSIAEGFIKGVDYPTIGNFNGKDLGFTNPALVGRLASFIRMKYDRLYRNLAVADGFYFDFYFIDIRIYPVQSFHNKIITDKWPDSQERISAIHHILRFRLVLFWEMGRIEQALFADGQLALGNKLFASL
jgi:hypothetical protein